MGLLQKMGLVETIPEETNYDVSITDSYEDTVDANIDNVQEDTLIEDVYAGNELADISKSIFKVEELINSLPKEMVTETKKASVLAILSSFGLTIDEVCTDGEDRIDILKAAESEIVSNNDNVISESESVIEECKLKIQEMEQTIAKCNENSKNTKEKVEAETKRIFDLIKFVGGEA